MPPGCQRHHDVPGAYPETIRHLCGAGMISAEAASSRRFGSQISRPTHEIPEALRAATGFRASPRENGPNSGHKLWHTTCPSHSYRSRHCCHPPPRRGARLRTDRATTVSGNPDLSILPVEGTDPRGSHLDEREQVDPCQKKLIMKSLRRICWVIHVNWSHTKFRRVWIAGVS